MTLAAEQTERTAPVVYEWRMMQATAWMLASGVGNGNVPLRNAIVESFVVHFRQLGRFFYDGDERDIRAGDFLSQSWASAVGREFPHLKSNRWQALLDRASKQVAHLTPGRLISEDKELWQHWRLRNEMAEYMRAFSALTGFTGFDHTEPWPEPTSTPAPSTFVSGPTAETITLAHLVSTASATNVVTTCNSIALPPGDPRS
jgi:hypothetical protein